MTVRTADRTLDVIESFARRQRSITVSALARELALRTSTCCALVRTLVDRGFLYCLQPRGAFYPTRRLSHVGDAIARHDRIARHIRPLLEALRDATGETVILGKLQGLGVVYLEIIESRNAVRYTMTVGSEPTGPMSAKALRTSWAWRCPSASSAISTASIWSARSRASTDTSSRTSLP